MGSSSSSLSAVEELCKIVQSGDASEVYGCLQLVAAARAGHGDPEALDGLRSLDLNALGRQGCSPLQLAAANGHIDVLRMLLVVAHDARLEFSIDSGNDWGLTALHFAARCTIPGKCTQCVLELLSCKADPYVASSREGLTPLEEARRAQCMPCVQALHKYASRWQGRVEHDEHTLLSIPSWKQRYLSVVLDRRANTGPGAQALVVTCYSCGARLEVSPYSLETRCRACNANIATPTSVQLALYDEGADFHAVPPSVPPSPMPSATIRLPADPSRIVARPIDEMGVETSMKFLREGEVRRSLQSLAMLSSSMKHGISLQILGTDKSIVEEHTFRVASEEDRASLLRVLSNPISVCLADSTPPLVRPILRQASSVVPPPATGAVPPASHALPSVAPALSVPASGAPARQRTLMDLGGQARPALRAAVAASEFFARTLRDGAAYASCTFDSSPRSLFAPRSPNHPPESQQADASDPAASRLAPTRIDAAPVDSPSVAEVHVVTGPSEGAPEQEQGLCVLCLERTADTAVVPCGHMCGCQDCMQQLQLVRPKCPLCRGPVQSTIRIYTS